MTTKTKRRPTLAEAAIMPLAPGIVRDPTTNVLTEPYCILTMDDAGSVQAMMYTIGAGEGAVHLTRTYWPGHADYRWPPTRVATTPQLVRQMLAERPQHMVAVPESVVWATYRGFNIGITAPTPE